MPSFAELKEKAAKAKDASVTKVQNVRDRNTSVPLKKTNWNPYNGEGPTPPPPPRTNSRTKPKEAPPLPPPPRRTPSAMSSSSTASGASGGSGGGPPPILRSTRPPLPSPSSSQGSLPPALPSRNHGATPPALPSRQGSTPPALPSRQSSTPPALPARKGSGTSPPPLPSRTPSFHREQPSIVYEEPQATGDFSWANLSQRDKEVLFGWLDEFFERSYGIKAQ